METTLKTINSTTYCTSHQRNVKPEFNYYFLLKTLLNCQISRENDEEIAGSSRSFQEEDGYLKEKRTLIK